MDNLFSRIWPSRTIESGHENKIFSFHWGAVSCRRQCRGRLARTGAEGSAPPTITQSEPWQFTIAAPGWLASMNGTIGVRGVNADIDVPVDEVLQHLDMIFAMRAEAQKGPFGIFGEFIYIGLSDGAQINGLINNIHEQVDLYFG